jgi:hypothetical protein
MHARKEKYARRKDNYTNRVQKIGIRESERLFP